MAAYDIEELAEGLPTWEQQPGEGDREYQLFLLYAQAGPARSVKHVVEAWNAARGDAVTESQVVGLLRRWRWVARSSAFVKTTGVAMNTLRHEMVAHMTAELFAESSRVRKMLLAVIEKANIEEMEPEQVRKQLASLMQMYRQIAELTISVLSTLREFVADGPSEPSGADGIEKLLKKAYEERLARSATAQPLDLQVAAPAPGRLVTVNGVAVLVGENGHVEKSPVAPA